MYLETMGWELAESGARSPVGRACSELRPRHATGGIRGWCDVPRTYSSERVAVAQNRTQQKEDGVNPVLFCLQLECSRRQLRHARCPWCRSNSRYGKHDPRHRWGRLHRIQLHPAADGAGFSLDREPRQAYLRGKSAQSGDRSNEQRMSSFVATLRTATWCAICWSVGKPRAIVHFAAESHVDRSIRGPEDFIRTNIDGTFALLEEVRAYWGGLADRRKRLPISARFHR